MGSIAIRAESPTLTLDCLAFGSCGFDVLLTVDRAPSSDQRVPAHAVSSGGGGPAATAAAALARLGLRVELVSVVGDDIFGELIRAELSRQGVGIDAVRILANSPSNVSSVLIEQTGHRSMAAFSGCLSRIDLAQVNFDRIGDARCIHLDGNNVDLAEAAARRARKSGTFVSLDGGNISAASLARLLPLVDSYIPDEQSLVRQLGPIDPREACRRLHGAGPAVVCITRAERGCLAYDGLSFIESPAHAGIPIVDTTGAGDNFHGAFLYGHLAGWPLEETLTFSNTFAALCCRAIGGRGSVPDLAETRAFMRTFHGNSGDS
jgi:sugar/nucleoside kinase (ribokinase family)